MDNERPGLGRARMSKLRQQMKARRALCESEQTVAPYTDNDMVFEPLDSATQKRVDEVSRKAR